MLKSAWCCSPKPINANVFLFAPQALIYSKNRIKKMRLVKSDIMHENLIQFRFCDPAFFLRSTWLLFFLVFYCRSESNIWIVFFFARIVPVRNYCIDPAFEQQMFFVQRKSKYLVLWLKLNAKKLYFQPKPFRHQEKIKWRKDEIWCEDRKRTVIGWHSVQQCEKSQTFTQSAWLFRLSFFWRGEVVVVTTHAIDIKSMRVLCYRKNDDILYMRWKQVFEKFGVFDLKFIFNFFIFNLNNLTVYITPANEYILFVKRLTRALH